MEPEDWEGGSWGALGLKLGSASLGFNINVHFSRSLAVGINGNIHCRLQTVLLFSGCFSWQGYCKGLETATVLLWIGPECHTQGVKKRAIWRLVINIF